MGGQGSGRKPGINSLINRNKPTLPQSREDTLVLPDISATKKAIATKEVPGGYTFPYTDGTANQTLITDGAGNVTWQAVPAGTETDPVFSALSSSFLYESLSGSMTNTYLAQSLSGSLAYIPITDYEDFELSGSPTFMDLSGSMTNTYLAQSLSGSLPYIASADYGDFELSGSPTFMTLSGSMTGTYLAQSLSGSFVTSGSEIAHGDLVGTHNLTTDIDHDNLTNTHNLTTDINHDNLTGYVAAEHITASAFATSGSATVSLGTHISDALDPHGTLLTQNSISSSGIISGSTVLTTSDNDTSGSAIFRNILIGTEDSPGAASGWTQGTVYLKYTA